MYVQEKPTLFYANKNKANQCSAPVSIIAMRTIIFYLIQILRFFFSPSYAI